MALFKYFKKVPALDVPDPSGTLSSIMPTETIIAANKQVRVIEQAKRTGSKRGPYKKTNTKDKAAIGAYASLHGVAKTIRHFKDQHLKESSIRDWKKLYEKELRDKCRSAKPGEDVTVIALPERKRGRPPILGEKLDTYLRSYITAMRSRGTPVGSNIVIGVARGILLKHNRSALKEFGGTVQLSKGWAKQVLHRMGFTKRRANSKAKVTPANFEEIKKTYIIEIKSVVAIEEIPPQLVINWDHTAIKIVPSSSWTMEKKGVKRIEIVAIDDKRQITAVLACTLDGTFLPIQLIFQGKTEKCHPHVPFPSDWHITHTDNHWSNESTTIDYLKNIIIPYVERTRKNLELDAKHPALAIFDVFKGQCTSDVLQILKDNNILYVTVPNNCTDRLQPLDLSVNKAVKQYFRTQFQEWYGSVIYKQLQDGIEEEVDLRLSIMKPLSAQWMVECYHYLLAHPDLAINGFKAAGIKDACKFA